MHPVASHKELTFFFISYSLPCLSCLFCLDLSPRIRYALSAPRSDNMQIQQHQPCSIATLLLKAKTILVIGSRHNLQNLLFAIAHLAFFILAIMAFINSCHALSPVSSLGTFAFLISLNTGDLGFLFLSF